MLLTVVANKANSLDISGKGSSDCHVGRFVSNNSDLKVADVLIDTESGSG
jgi:hypothetical protein